MPTIASQPSLEKTQAVGALLWNEFARQRLLEAGIGEEVIQEVEKVEDIDRFSAAVSSDNSNGSSDSSEVTNESTATNISTSVASEPDTSRNSTSLIQEDTFSHGEQFHSIVEQNASVDKTVYHSMNLGTATSSVHSEPIMASYGRELRRIAEEFEKTPLRQMVKQRASKVNLASLSKETFIHLLEELFQDGVTRERIVVLFFFCTDVALIAASFARELMVKLMGWSFSFIIDTVCRVVHDIGGWDYELGVWSNIIFRQLPSILFSSCAFLGICVLAIQLHKSLRT